MNIDDMCVFFDEQDRFLITTHESPDADGIGAEYALCSMLLDMGKEACVVNAESAPPQSSFFDKRNLVGDLSQVGVVPEELKDWFLIIVDTDPTNIGAIQPLVIEACRDVIVIDHHNPRKNIDVRGYFSPDSSSTCEMVFEILESMNSKISEDMAIALYTGIVFDTGSFVYPKTHARTFGIAETLVNLGVVPRDVWTHLHESKSKEALMLQAYVSQTMELHDDDRIAIQTMSRDTLIASGAHFEECQGIVNIPLQCARVRVSVFLKERRNGERRCSLRSKGEVDCSIVAYNLGGGGGHTTAAGFRFEASFTEIQDKILEMVHRCF